MEYGAAVDAATVLDAACDELLALLSDPNITEETVHQWLRPRAHWLFLDSQAVRAWSKQDVGKQETDFVVRRADGTYVLIELERPTLDLFQDKNREPTAPLNHAIQQVRDWRRYIRDNVHTVRSELGFQDIYEPGLRVIAGRSSFIQGKEATDRWHDLQGARDPEMLTYDDICASVRAIAANLRVLMTSRH